MGGGEEAVSLGFLPFLGRVYLVIIFVVVGRAEMSSLDCSRNDWAVGR